MTNGIQTQVIQVLLDISGRTVQGHLANVFAKLHVASRTHPVHWIVAAGGGALLYLAGLVYARRRASAAAHSSIHSSRPIRKQNQ